MNRIVIPARGTVWFSVFNLDPGEPALNIHGPSDWVRPVVGLLFVKPIELRRSANGKAECFEGDDPLHPPEGTCTDSYPLVVDELGRVFEVFDYLTDVVGESHWDHADHIYRPHVDGPVTAAPRVKPAARSGQSA